MWVSFGDPAQRDAMRGEVLPALLHLLGATNHDGCRIACLAGLKTMAASPGTSDFRWVDATGGWGQQGIGHTFALAPSYCPEGCINLSTRTDRSIRCCNQAQAQATVAPLSNLCSLAEPLSQ